MDWGECLNTRQTKRTKWLLWAAWFIHWTSFVELCWLNLWHLTHETGYQCCVWMFGRRPPYFHTKQAWNISIILKGFRILGRNWVFFSKMVHSKAIHCLERSLTARSGWKTIENDIRQGSRSGCRFSLGAENCQWSVVKLSVSFHRYLNIQMLVLMNWGSEMLKNAPSFLMLSYSCQVTNL